jgi:hypothetical protein
MTPASMVERLEARRALLDLLRRLREGLVASGTSVVVTADQLDRLGEVLDDMGRAIGERGAPADDVDGVLEAVEDRAAFERALAEVDGTFRIATEALVAGQSGGEGR